MGIILLIDCALPWPLACWLYDVLIGLMVFWFLLCSISLLQCVLARWFRGPGGVFVLRAFFVRGTGTRKYFCCGPSCNLGCVVFPFGHPRIMLPPWRLWGTMAAAAARTHERPECDGFRSPSLRVSRLPSIRFWFVFAFRFHTSL